MIKINPAHRIKFLLLILVLSLILLLDQFVKLDIDSIQKALSGLPVFTAALIYIISYVVITFFVFFSKDLLWFMGAFLFGPYFSALFICIAEIINAFILFYLARLLGRSYVENKLSGKYRNLDERLGKLSFFWLFIFRAAPLIPYRFLDLASGLTSMKFRRYLAVVILGTPLKMFWIQYIIYTAGLSIFKDPHFMIAYFLSNKIILSFGFVYLLLAFLAIVKLLRRLK